MLSILCPINPSAHLHNHSQPDCNVHCKELHLCAKTRGLGALQSPGLVDLPTQLLSILDFYLLSWRWRPQWLWNNLLLQARTSRTQFQASFTSGFVPSTHLNRTEEEEWSILVVPCRACTCQILFQLDVGSVDVIFWTYWGSWSKCMIGSNRYAALWYFSLCKKNLVAVPKHALQGNELSNKKILSNAMYLRWFFWPF